MRRDDIEADHALANKTEELKHQTAERMVDLAIEAVRRGADKNEALFNAFRQAMLELKDELELDIKELYQKT